MPSITLEPDTNYRIPFKAEAGDLFSYSITSDIPVRSYVMRPKGIQDFDADMPRFKYYGGFPDARKLHRQTIMLPVSGRWYLLIINLSDSDEAEIEYELGANH